MTIKCMYTAYTCPDINPGIPWHGELDLSMGVVLDRSKHASENLATAVPIQSTMSMCIPVFSNSCLAGRPHQVRMKTILRSCLLSRDGAAGNYVNLRQAVFMISYRGLEIRH